MIDPDYAAWFDNAARHAVHEARVAGELDPDGTIRIRLHTSPPAAALGVADTPTGPIRFIPYTGPVVVDHVEVWDAAAVRPVRECVHGIPDAFGCRPCADRAHAADLVDLPDLAAGLDRHPDAIQCGCCELPIEPAEPRTRTPGGEPIHRGCAT